MHSTSIKSEPNSIRVKGTKAKSPAKEVPADQRPYKVILRQIQAKRDAKESLSQKDELFDQIARQLDALHLVDEVGKIKQLEKRASLGGMEFIPFSEYPVVAENERWTKTFAPLLNSPQDTPYLTPIGSAIGLENLYSLQKIPVDALKASDPELAKFEGAEMFEKGLFRGIYEPVMGLVRIVQWNDKLYERTPVPKGALPPLPSKKLSTISISEVEVENIHANVGFHRLVRLVEKGKLLADSKLYRELLMEAQEYKRQLSVDTLLGPEALRAITPPHAMGKRNQGNGRIIIMVAKKLFFVESTWAQPLQRYLETQPWYAGGDRLTRLKRMRFVLFGKPGTCLVDGDDFIIKLKNGVVLCGDYSSYESSVRDIDHTLVWDWIVSAFKGLKRELVYNLGRASGFADFVTGIGIAKRSPLHGIDSGRATTHTEESILNKATLQAADWSDIDSLVRDLTKMGRIMRKSAQQETRKYAFLAKLACDGKKIFGSVVRGLWGICMPEDPPGLEFHKEGPDLYWASRTIAILANSVGNPQFDWLINTILKYGGSLLREQIAKTTKRQIIASALRKLDKTREFSGEVVNKPGVIERRNIDYVYKRIIA